MFSCFTRRMIALLNRTHLAVVPSRSRRPRKRQRAFRPQLEVLPSRIAPSVDLWTGANNQVDIHWSDGGNWSLGRAPGSGDIAQFTTNSTAVKDAESVDDISATIGGLIIDGSWGATLTIGTLNNPVTLKLTSGSTNEWDSGSISLDGSAGTLINNGTLTLNNANEVDMIGGGTFTNNGVLNFANTGTLVLEGANNLDFNLNNSSGATIDFQNDARIDTNGDVVINNAGLMEKTGGTGTTTFSVGGGNDTLANTGTLDVASGTLSLGIDTTGTNGIFQTAKGALLDLTDGTFTEKGTFSATGVGEILLDGATLAAGSSGAASSDVTFNIASTTAFDWTAGTIHVPSNATLTFNGTLTLNNANEVDMIGGGTFTNNGVLNFANTGTLVLEGANNLDFNLNNSSGATIDFQNDARIDTNGDVVINNAGLMEKTGGTGTSDIGPSGGTTLANTGTIAADSGTLSLGINISKSGSMTAGAGSTLTVAGNLTQTAADSLNIDIGGTPASGQFGQIAVQGTANLAGSFNVSLVKGFTPSSGQDFKVMTFANHSGAFNNVSGVSPDFVEQLNPASLDLVAGNAAGAPVITGDPSNQTVTAGQSVSFTASASGTPTPTVQWQVSSNGGVTFSNISGANSTTLTLNNVTTSMSGYEYRAVFTNSAGGVVTSAATLTVNAPSPSPPPPPPSPPAPPPLHVPPLLALIDSLLGGTETVNGNGTETVTDSFFGIPLFVSTYNSAGNLMSVTLFGINITFLFA